VATPIGHLDDITLRALRVLGEVDVVAAEDTRRTGNLLRHFGLHTRLVSLHAHNERARATHLVEQLCRDRSVALVSDAGTPGISDPGSDLIRRAREAGVRVEVIPGPSAVSAAISLAGLEKPGFAFLGFPPTRAKDRFVWMDQLRRFASDVAIVFFEAPHRIERTLKDLSFLGKHQIMLFRELTKLHEEVRQGSPEELLAALGPVQGEFTIVVPSMQSVENKAVAIDKASVEATFGQMAANGAGSRREIARQVGKRFGLTTRQVYELTKG
jgi:16S rRNA (cytidine1402-2'-O)-methyltransferase